MNGSREDRRSKSRPRLVGEIVRLGPGTYGVPGDEKRRWALLECLGRVMECDLGKRVYDVSEPGDRVIYQCENAEQRDARLATRKKEVSMNGSREDRRNVSDAIAMRIGLRMLEWAGIRDDDSARRFARAIESSLIPHLAGEVGDVIKSEKD